VAFVSFAMVQLNDPDPLAWTALYTLAALTCVAAAAGWRLGPAPVALAAGCLLWAGWLTWGFPDTGQRWTGEVGREIGGLTLVVLWMAGIAWAHHRCGLRASADRAK
jgi:hypothetical protein